MKWVFIKMGILNVFRNKRRSFLTASVIGVGLMSLMLAQGLMQGMEDYMVKSITEDFIGHAQIHHLEFRKTNKTKYILEDGQDLEREFSTDKNIAGFSPRVISPALIASAEGSNQVSLFGINPQMEKSLSKVHKNIIQGDFLDNDSKSIIIGKRLAKKLNVEIGGKIVITLSSLKGESLSQELFRVRGIFSLGSREFDNQIAFINLDKAQKMLNCTDCVHEIGLRFKNLQDLDLNFPIYKNKISKNSTIFESWRELVPSLDSALQLNDISLTLMVLLLAVLVGAAVVNTLFMSIFERKFEFGVLLAIGTRRSLLFSILMYESITLSLLAIILGSLLTLIFGGYLAVYGVDYGGVSFASVALRDPIYFVFGFKNFLIFSVGLILFTMIISIYPVLKLLQIYPSKALKIM